MWGMAEPGRQQGQSRWGLSGLLGHRVFSLRTLDSVRVGQGNEEGPGIFPKDPSSTTFLKREELRLREGVGGEGESRLFTPPLPPSASLRPPPPPSSLSMYPGGPGGDCAPQLRAPGLQGLCEATEDGQVSGQPLSNSDDVDDERPVFTEASPCSGTVM